MRCKYIRKIFQNEENGYTVALFSTLDHEVPLSARDKFWADKKIIAFTAKGYDLPLTDEIEIEMEGEWETNSHGTQYKVETFLEVVPRTRETVRSMHVVPLQSSFFSFPIGIFLQII